VSTSPEGRRYGMSRLAGVRNALLAGRVTVAGNHLPGMREPVSTGPEVPHDAVFLSGNRT